MSSIFSFFTTGKYWLIAIAVAFIMGTGFGWHERVLREPQLLEAQQAADNKQCNIDKQITRKANHELQNSRDAIARRLDSLKLQPVRCINVTGPARATSGDSEHAGQNGNGLTTDFLRDFAAECETYRSEVNVCISFLAQEREKH